MDIMEKAAYLKGLTEGYELDKNPKEGKVLTELLDLVSMMAERIVALENECAELREYIEEIDNDLGLVEDDLYLDDEDSYDEEYENDFDNDFEDDDSGYDEIECPSCGEIICVDETLELSEVVCPACGEKLGDVELCDGNCSSCTSCDEE